MIDGPLLVREALEVGVRIESAFFESAIFDRSDEGVLVSDLESAGVTVHEVATDSLKKVLDLGSPQPIAAVALQTSTPLDELLAAAVERRRPLLVAAGVSDPGNAGTIVRTAEAAGCAGVVMTSGSVDLFNPKVVRASAGALFRVPVSREVPLQDLVEACAHRSVELVATVAREGDAPEAVDLSGATAILVGSESHGIPEELEAAAALRVTIPMEGQVESLNAGVAAAVLAFEAARQRRQRP